MNDQMTNNPDINSSHSTIDVLKKIGVLGIRNALIILNLFRAVSNSFGFLFILDPDLQNLGWSVLLSSASQIGVWRLLDPARYYVVVNGIIGTEFLLAIVATVLLFLSLYKQRWGAMISICAFGLDFFLWWRSGDTAIIAYLLDIAVLILALIHFVKLKNPLFSESTPMLNSPNRDVAEPNPFSPSYRRDYRPKK